MPGLPRGALDSHARHVLGRGGVDTLWVYSHIEYIILDTYLYEYMYIYILYSFISIYRDPTINQILTKVTWHYQTHAKYQKYTTHMSVVSKNKVSFENSTEMCSHK